MAVDGAWAELGLLHHHEGHQRALGAPESQVAKIAQSICAWSPNRKQPVIKRTNGKSLKAGLFSQLCFALWVCGILGHSFVEEVSMSAPILTDEMLIEKLLAHLKAEGYSLSVQQWYPVLVRHLLDYRNSNALAIEAIRSVHVSLTMTRAQSLVDPEFTSATPVFSATASLTAIPLDLATPTPATASLPKPVLTTPSGLGPAGETFTRSPQTGPQLPRIPGNP